MGQEFIKMLKKEINNNEALEDKEIEILRFQFYKKSQTLKIILKATESLNPAEEEEFKKIVLKSLGFDVNIEILCYKDVSNISLEDIIGREWSSVVEEIARKIPLCRPVLYSTNKHIEGKIINISSGNQTLIKHAVNKKVALLIESSIKDIYSMNVKVEFKFNEALAFQEKYEANKKEENIKIIKETMDNRVMTGSQASNSNSSKDNYNGPKAEKKNDYKSYKREPKDENTVYGRSIRIDTTEIKDIDETSGYVSVIGDVFKTEMIETKT